MAKKKAPSDSSAAREDAAAPRPRRAAPRRTSTRRPQPAELSGTSSAAIETAADSSSDTEFPGAHSPSYEEIAEAAYHRFLKRGGRDGGDVDDWIEAERELRASRTRTSS